MEENNNSEWHLSRYNLFGSSSIDGLIPCVNLMKGTYSELSIKDLELLHKIDNIDKNSLLFNCLVNQGLIVNYDELKKLKYQAKKVNSTMDAVKIIITVTLSCNFNCPYCFESHRNGTQMTSEIEEKIFLLIKKMMELKQSKKLEITWYGGEPLLYPSTIEHLSKKILKYVEENNISYFSNIFTNGYFLNQKNIDMLERNKIFRCQLTLDGIGENHNKTRHLKNGQPSYEKIMSNLESIKYKGIISIRHNVHKDNIKDIDNLKQIIKNIKKKTGNKIEYYSATIIDNPGEKREEQVSILNIEEAAKIQAKKDAMRFPHGEFIYCGSQHFWSICIDERGYLYKCWEDVGNLDRAFANIEDWNPSDPYDTSNNVDILKKYLEDIPVLSDIECQNCIWLPSCAGGCPSKKFFWNMKCVPYKNYPDLFISEVREKINK